MSHTKKHEVMETKIVQCVLVYNVLRESCDCMSSIRSIRYQCGGIFPHTTVICNVHLVLESLMNRRAGVTNR